MDSSEYSNLRARSFALQATQVCFGLLEARSSKLASQLYSQMPQPIYNNAG